MRQALEDDDQGRVEELLDEIGELVEDDNTRLQRALDRAEQALDEDDTAKARQELTKMRQALLMKDQQRDRQQGQQQGQQAGQQTRNGQQAQGSEQEDEEG